MVSEPWHAFVPKDYVSVLTDVRRYLKRSIPRDLRSTLGDEPWNDLLLEVMRKVVPVYPAVPDGRRLAFTVARCLLAKALEQEGRHSLGDYKVSVGEEEQAVLAAVLPPAYVDLLLRLKASFKRKRIFAAVSSEARVQVWTELAQCVKVQVMPHYTETQISGDGSLRRKAKRLILLIACGIDARRIEVEDSIRRSCSADLEQVSTSYAKWPEWMSIHKEAFLQRLEQARLQLEPQQYQVVRLTLANFTDNQIAAALGISVKQVQQQRSRALAVLRDLFAKET